MVACLDANGDESETCRSQSVNIDEVVRLSLVQAGQLEALPGGRASCTAARAPQLYVMLGPAGTWGCTRGGVYPGRVHRDLS